MFDDILSAVAAARTPGQGVRACARLENAACAARLGFMADMLEKAYAESGSAEREQWRFDNWSAVCARIGAAQEVTSGAASALLSDALVLRERLPRVGTVFAEGLISYRLVRMICSRTMLVTHAEALRGLDAELAEALRDWGAKSVDRAQHDVDAVVLKHDRYAVRRIESSCRSAYVDVKTNSANGVAYMTATISAPDGEAVDKRADALARTVCERDPRTMDQRRGAAMGAMAFGWDRLPCLCESEACSAATKPAGGGVVIHVIAHQDTVASASANDAHPADRGVGVDGVTHTECDRATTTPGASSPADTDCAATQPPNRDVATQRRALAGQNPPLLPKPWHSYSLAGLLAALAPDQGEFCAARPALILGGVVLPAAVAAQVAQHATIRTLVHPGKAPSERRYRPSKRLADFVRCRDQTCRFPGCHRPATNADIDHTIPYPYGPTAAANLACLCREHHLLKTFWAGWSNVQYPDGTIVWTDPDGHATTTYPGCRTVFPELCAPTLEVPAAAAVPQKHIAGLTMPRRTVTRVRARQQRVDDERRRNAEGPEVPRWKNTDRKWRSACAHERPQHTATEVRRSESSAGADEPPPF